MAPPIFSTLLLFFLSTFQNIELLNAMPNNSTATRKCILDIHFPFHLNGHQSHHCKPLPGFELLCKNTNTTIHFPSYGDLVVESISYGIKKMDLIDPKNCVHQVFLNLDLSLTPFQYYYVVKNFTYLNCSTRLSPSFAEIPCLSGSNYHLYTVDPSFPLPDQSCKPVKTVAIPFAYSPYLSDNSFGLGLTWDLPQSQGCNRMAQNIVLIGMMICIIAVALFASLKIHHSNSKKPSHEEEKNMLLRLTDDVI